MRMSREEKDHSRRRIVAAASRMLRERGVDGTSVADAMHEAGLTHGGFYRHFENKEALLIAALDAAFAEILARFETSAGPMDADAFEAFYLSKTHVDHRGPGCPAAALASDIAHRTKPLRHAFGGGIRRMIETLAAASGPPRDTSQAVAARRLAMMVGAVALARASDRATAKFVLDACRE